jgi:transposase
VGSETTTGPRSTAFSEFCTPARPGPRGGRLRTRRLVGDKGYRFRPVRRYLRSRGIQAVIPTRKDQRPNPCFDEATDQRRNVIERAVGWLKTYRRLATRFEKCAVNFLAMVELAMIQRCLKTLCSPDRTWLASGPPSATSKKTS